MIVGLGLVILLVLGVLIAIAARAWSNRQDKPEEGGLDLIPYLLMALAVAIVGFSLAGLARASLTPDRLAGRPTGEIAGALAGLVVATPVAYLLWRRQARRRRVYPPSPGWPIYLALVELVFLIAFFVAVAQFGDALVGTVTADWTDLVIYGGIVGFHWWAERRDPPQGDAAELPRLIGAAVAVVALTVGLVGTVDWLLSEAFDSIWGLFQIPEPQIPLALAIAGGGVWSWRWLPGWGEERTTFRNVYLGFVTSAALIMAVGALVALVSTLISFLLGTGARVQDHFSFYPEALALALVGGSLWWHHRQRLAPGRHGDRRGHEYAMAATGLSALVGSTTALIDSVFEPRLAGTGELMVGLGCTVIAAGWVWLWFWRKTQSAPRSEEVPALPRRVYLIGMAILTGLTAAGSLIATLVVVFRAVLGEGGELSDDLRLPVILTATSGVAAWHLFTHIRADGEVLRRTEVRPFSVTVICSHPGILATLFPKEATMRVIYRGDDLGVIDDAMAAAIVDEVDASSSLVWVDGTGFRVAAARQT